MITQFWALGNALFSPMLIPTSALSEETTTVFAAEDLLKLTLLLLLVTTQMQFQTLAYVTDKAVRVAPIATFVLVLNCLIDVCFFGTQLSMP